MRIDRSTVGQVTEKSATSESGKPQTAKTDEPAHKVNVSDAASAIAHRQKAHTERLAKVRAELESGTYKVDRQKLAVRMADEELARKKK